MKLAKNKFSKIQIERIRKFSQLINTIIPQISGPQWLIKVLSKILPDYCVFEKSIFINGILILYIPKLCQLNPLFNAILEYRLSTYDIS